MKLSVLPLAILALPIAVATYGYFHFSGLAPSDVDLLTMQTAQGRDQAHWRLIAAVYAGNARAIRAKGLLNVAGGSPESVRDGIRQLREAARDGEDEAALDLGRLYFWGPPGGKPDYAEARTWLEPIAGRYAAAAYYLALLDRNGLAGQANLARAMVELKSAADGGIAEALLLLGNAYRDGDGVARNDEAAVRCYERAAVLENAGALQALAEAYARGELGLPRDDAKAGQLFALSEDALHDPPRRP